VSERVAIFGGSFNPPHVAHVLAVALLWMSGEVDRILLVPTFRHPFGKPLAPFDDRVKMCEAAVGWLPCVSVSRVEEDVGGEGRTVHMLERLGRLYPDWRMRLVLGADLLLEADKWYRFDRVCELAPPILLGRTGFAAEGAPAVLLPGVSSTEVRTLIADGRWADVAPLVPHGVLTYVRERRLYAR
jgi:nicotinate-nucleotide adenylyltransferase